MLRFDVLLDSLTARQLPCILLYVSHELLPKLLWLLYARQLVGHCCTLVYPRYLAHVLELLQLRRVQLDLAVDASRQSLVPAVLEGGHESPQPAKHWLQMRSPLRACVRRRSRSGCAYHARRLCCLSRLLDAVVLRVPEMTPPKTHKRTSIPSFANLRMQKSCLIRKRYDHLGSSRCGASAAT